MFAWKMIWETAKNWDVGRGQPNTTSSGSLKKAGSGILILEQLQLTLVFTHGQLWELT